LGQEEQMHLKALLSLFAPSKHGHAAAVGQSAVYFLGSASALLATNVIRIVNLVMLRPPIPSQSPLDVLSKASSSEWSQR
jgi:hypothetical protein